MSKMKHTIVGVTPEIAAAWLRQNIAHNRTLRAAEVARLAGEMKAGRWVLTPTGIVFDTNGKLIDGQHRLSAVVLSGCTVQMIVWHNVETDVLNVLDTGRGRSLVDVLTVTQSVGADVPARNIVPRANAIYGLHHPEVKIAKFTSVEYEWVKERYLEDLVWSSRVYPNGGPGVKIGSVIAKIRSAPVMGALVIAHKKAPEEIESFTRRLDRGLELTETDSAYALRRFLEGSSLTGTSRHEFSFAALRAAYAAIHRRKLSIIKPSFLTRTNPEFAEMLKFFGVAR
jgi:hypothetical protein